MRVIITAGGTGGHIYPALAIINKIKEKEPNSEFLYIGTHNRMEKDIVPKCGYRYEAIEIYGFSKTMIKRDFKNSEDCFSVNVMDNTDIVIKDLGFINVKKACTVKISKNLEFLSKF